MQSVERFQSLIRSEVVPFLLNTQGKEIEGQGFLWNFLDGWRALLSEEQDVNGGEKERYVKVRCGFEKYIWVFKTTLS